MDDMHIPCRFGKLLQQKMQADVRDGSKTVRLNLSTTRLLCPQ